ncbi:hypothetical protein [Variovorax saccharolyticus]|uniref:hypothetical protein n=1 Tax=Variovorax saccharolyticus TaxID=3053516 RepID=UPI0025754CC2|nr:MULTISPECIES: hypothetical protein [unclassified Variovorax]MDM0022660.1 hypothetical protein [Variovorax sp. J22R187]MDM0029555.1 hypothetical protein [Variovorax sp. J31P216]
MLSIDQKAHILRRAGAAVPARPERQMTAQSDGRLEGRGAEPLRAWEEQIERLYARYALERAKRSLRQAEASLQMGATRHPADRPRGP